MVGARRLFTRSWVELVVPVVVIMALGGIWIAVHATGGRGGTHTVFQILALCESGIALLLRRRKPVGSLASILVVYGLVDLDTIMILPVLLALLTVAELRERRTVAIAAAATAMGVAIMPYLHGDAVSLGGRTVPHLAAVALSVVLGLWLRARRRVNAHGSDDLFGDQLGTTRHTSAPPAVAAAGAPGPAAAARGHTAAATGQRGASDAAVTR